MDLVLDIHRPIRAANSTTCMLLQDSPASEEFAMIDAVGDNHGAPEELERVLGLIQSLTPAYGIPYGCRVADGAVPTRRDRARRPSREPRGEAAGQGDRLAQVELWPHNNQAASIESYDLAIGGKVPRRFLRRFYLEALPTEQRTWMASLPHRVCAPFFVHAGIHPNHPLDLRRLSNLR